ncbi:MAG: hypothetical protein SRB2_04169 [Desulfobacteraceae bacterium Eth-SRB2]|nr:MAG: hypothetical protein SRB2_04169 [Desulfobacteraceae bacterium Eth-SRB2]
MFKFKINTRPFCIMLAISLLCIGLFAIAEAHEIWFYCPQNDVKVGDNVSVEYAIGETLFVNPDPDWLDWIAKESSATKVYVVGPDGKKSEIKLGREEKVFAGTFRAEKKGTYIVNYVLENDFRTKTTNGWKRQSPEGLKNVIRSVNANLYQKVIVNVEGSSNNYSRKLGGLMEIIPVDDPSKAKVGDEIRFRVTYKGKNAPMDVVVWGSYPGYSNRSHNWCYFGIPDKDGLIYFRPLRNGPWQIGAEKYLDEEMLKEKQKTGIKPSFAAIVTFWIP